MKVNHMNFLESAMVMIPSLTGMDLTLCGETPDVLAQFEEKRCFSPELQQIYTQAGLTNFLQNASALFIYDIAEPMGTHLMLIPAAENWVLLGPYVEEGWSARAARLLLTAAGASEAAMPLYQAYRCKLPIVQQDCAFKTALLLAEHLDGAPRTVKAIRLDSRGGKDKLTFSDAYGNAAEVNQRYLMEDRFIAAIVRGDERKAREALAGVGRMSTGVKFISDSFQDQLAAMAILRTEVRLAAKWGGLSPVLIDATSQEYAQKMRHAASKRELEYLTVELVERFCAEMQKRKNSGYSPAIRRSVDYMEVNLSKAMTTAEVAREAGLGQKCFAGRFRRETGMTVKEYLARRRCDIAAQLLVDSRASIQEVAAYVGYPDNNYFSKVFRSNTGLTPQAYRSAHQAPGPSP